ncbi:MAG TPA: hypothetical protein PKD72_08940 [Gemmatales bacterium]|nr:hypothetical protein [Gemmatales bacterium]
MPSQFYELGLLLGLILLVSTGVVLWLQTQKKRMSPLLPYVILLVLVTAMVLGIQYTVHKSSGKMDPTTDTPYRQALRLLNERYPSYTTINNVNGVNRDVLVKRFEAMTELDLGELKEKVQQLKKLVEEAPSSGQPGIYNMRMTSEIQACWEELRQALEKRAQ